MLKYLEHLDIDKTEDVLIIDKYKQKSKRQPLSYFLEHPNVLDIRVKQFE